jgi:voltage-gated potassium channel
VRGTDQGTNPLRRLLTAAGLFLGLVVLGALGYVLLERYTLLEGLYMSVITITTVGFSEVRPLSETGRAFTALLILAGFACLAYAGHVLVQSLMEEIWSQKAERRRMRKRIAQLRDHVIICGFGRVGAVVAQELARVGRDFVVIESRPQVCARIRKRGWLLVEADATYEEPLLEAGVKTAGAVLALLDSDPQNLFVVLTARELNPTLRIISRVEDPASERRILRAGADRVLSPFTSMGRQVIREILGENAAAPEEEEAREPNPTLRWLAVDSGSPWIGRPLERLAQEQGAGVVGLRRGSRDWVMPDPRTTLRAGDRVLLLPGLKPRGAREVGPEAERPKIVIVDDEPVIRTLYTRLFAREGFHPLTARTGKEALEVIRRERPYAAVIDFMLPVLSGVEVCREIRSDPRLQEVRLVLFTSDDSPETRQRALAAGADGVVVKSPEALKVVRAVQEALEGAGRLPRAA